MQLNTDKPRYLMKYPRLRGKKSEKTSENNTTNQNKKPHSTWSFKYSEGFCLKARKKTVPDSMLSCSILTKLKSKIKKPNYFQIT